MKKYVLSLKILLTKKKKIINYFFFGLNVQNDGENVQNNQKNKKKPFKK